ncbi:ATP-binding protein [Pseudomonas sp. Gutcm_11s]|uniref:ATP-binding protein n=1 Tax=Pseudomonas sp. Gutcm_11s TaxID=3026088 RepID=UPI00235E0653|nr:ATP-binding protein [Pseudomonas sp. Gutcm_11s]MDD0842874.1 ATP-binding protein [Pseudomonas sp. Gutcm_11s]
MIRSLRVRLMLGATALAVVFMLALLPVLQSTFRTALENVIEQRLGADAATLISAAQVDGERLAMPEQLPDEEFNLLDSKLIGLIFDRDGNLVWRSPSSGDQPTDYLPRYDGEGHEFLRHRNGQGIEYFVYDLEVDLLRGQAAAFSIVTMQPASDYQALLNDLDRRLWLWLGGALLVLLGLLWLGLTWGFGSLRGLSRELDEVESGKRDHLTREHPLELLRLTDSLNHLLEGERRQRERYRDSLGDLAHSLKTPLAVLQGVGETLAMNPGNREQAQVLGNQVERMSQQVSYQLQRASLRKSGLVRHREPLAAALDTLCGALDKVYRDKRVQVIRDLPANLQVPMERDALLELLGNLLENAYRLCLEQIRVSARQDEGGYELVVEDDGPGVPASQRERILKRGERLDSQHPGQGIGTAVVVDILDSYDGQLLLEDSALGGACFRIRLPG